MDEMYAMLGREHQADLGREAQKRHLAAVAGLRPVLPDKPRSKRRRMLVFLRPRQA
jgi:hypothetical protein